MTRNETTIPDISWITTQPIITLHYKTIPEDGKERTIQLKNIFNPVSVQSTGSKAFGAWYLQFEGKLGDDCIDLNLELSLKYKIHIPLKTFEFAWNRVKGTLPPDRKTMIYDCKLKIIKTFRKLKIIERMFIKVGPLKGKHNFP